MLFFTKRKYFFCKYFVNFTDLITRQCRKNFILIVKIYNALYNVYFLLFIFFCSVCKYCINVIIVPNIPYWIKSVSYTHLTLPTICSVQISVVAVSLKNNLISSRYVRQLDQQQQRTTNIFSSRRRHTRCREVSWARRCV